MEKAIVIKEENREVIAAAIAEAQKRARVRKIDEHEVFEAAEAMEAYLYGSIGLTRREMNGIKVSVNTYAKERFANAYNGTPEATWFDIEYTRTGWKLVDIYRSGCYNWAGHEYKIEYPEKLTAEQVMKRVSVYG